MDDPHANASGCNVEWLYPLFLGPVFFHCVYRFLTDPLVRWASAIWKPDQAIEKQKLGKNVVKFIAQLVAFTGTLPCVVLLLSRASLKMTLTEYEDFRKVGCFYLSVYLWEFGHDSQLKWPSLLHHVAVLLSGVRLSSGSGTAEHIVGILTLVSFSQTMIYFTLLLYYFGMSKARLSSILVCTIMIKATAIIGVQVWGVTFLIINDGGPSAFAWKISLQVLVFPAHVSTLMDLLGIRRKFVALAAERAAREAVELGAYFETTA